LPPPPQPATKTARTATVRARKGARVFMSIQ
jgi:hypothetical protein